MKKILSLSFLSCLFFTTMAFSQNPTLFEHVWYVHYYQMDGQVHHPPVNVEVPFVQLTFHEYNNSQFQLQTAVCGYAGGGLLNFSGENTFSGQFAFTQGPCFQANESFAGMMQMFWSCFGLFTYEFDFQTTFIGLTITNACEDLVYLTTQIPLNRDAFNFSSAISIINPVVEKLKIQSTYEDALHLYIYDIQGRMIQSQTLLPSQNQVDVQALNPGMYLAVFQNEKGEQVSKKFLKQ
jgi:hypothetical protein